MSDQTPAFRTVYRACIYCDSQVREIKTGQNGTTLLMDWHLNAKRLPCIGSQTPVDHHKPTPPIVKCCPDYPDCRLDCPSWSLDYHG